MKEALFEFLTSLTQLEENNEARQIQYAVCIQTQLIPWY
jgi:hypothetical protein